MKKLFENLWNWFTTPNTDDCCDAEVCEQNTPVEPQEQPQVDFIFKQLCISRGCGAKEIQHTNAVQLFCDWYVGPATEEDILKCIPNFCNAHPAVNAKLRRFFE